MSHLIVLNVNCFQTQKELTTLDNIGVLIKGVLIDLHAYNFKHAKIFVAHMLVTVCHLSSPEKLTQTFSIKGIF